MEPPGDYRKRAATQHGTILLEATRQATGELARSFFFSEPVAWLEAREPHNLPGLFEQLEAARKAGLWTAGYFSYECGYHWEPTAAPDFIPAPNGLPAAAFGVYRKPVIFASPPPQPNTGQGINDGVFTIGPEAFARKIAAIRRWIEAGDTYQVNLTDRIQARFEGGATALFTHMMEAQPVQFGALLRVGDCCILSASPELFFHLKGREIKVRPMKGTSRRGRDAEEDAALVAALAADEKSRAENIMIADLLRSDLGRIAEMGSVRVTRLFAVERFPSLLQMSSEIKATLRADVAAYTLLGSLFPSGSIVGAPKVRTMQILRELEGRERGIYTGAIGFFAPGGEAVFSVAIRTAVLEANQVKMGVGAGITYDSNVADEYAECLLKGDFLREMPFDLIETMRWEKGRCALLSLHLDRLEASARYFGFHFSRPALVQAIEAEAARFPHASVTKLRLLLHRDGMCVFSSQQVLKETGSVLRVMVWPDPVHSGDRFLRHKTTRRFLYDKAIREAQQRGYVDALFYNERDMVTEGAVHNIMVRHGSTWRTPPLDAGVLPGVYRAHLLQTMPGVLQEEFTLNDLQDADEIWLVNAVRGARAVEIDFSTAKTP